MTVPDVTVVIPTKDRSSLLRTTLATVRAQRLVAVQIVIVDDGSRPEQAAEVAALAGGAVTVLRNTSSRGVAAARNQGIRAARAPWVAFLDDDDLWTPGKLAGQVHAATQASRSWVYTGAVKFATGPVVWQLMPPPPPQEVAQRLADRCLVPAGSSNVLAETRVLRELGGFDEDLAHMADWDMWLRLLEVGPPAAAPGIGVGYRLHLQAMSLNPTGMLRELAVLDTRWRHLREGRPLEAGPTHLWIAMSWLRAGRRGRAAAAYARAVRTRPRLGLRGLVRTLHPSPPSPAHVTRPAFGSVRRLKRVQRVEVPEDMNELLERWARPDVAVDAAAGLR